MIDDRLVIFLGLRAWFSFIGIVIIFLGTWMTEREWDEIKLGQEEEYQLSEDNDSLPKTKPKMEELLTKRSSIVTLAGWFLLALSQIFSKSDWFSVQVPLLTVASMILLMGLGFLQTVIVRQATVAREMKTHRVFLGVTMGLGLLLEGVLSATLNPAAPKAASPIGALLVAISPIIFWRSRRRGHSWDTEAKLHESPRVFHFGGPMMTMGWYWFWIGMNAVQAIPDGGYIPVHLSARTVIAHFGAALVLGVYWCVCAALDEHDDENVVVLEEGMKSSEETETQRKFPAFGQAGYLVGNAWEIKFVMAAAWVVLAVATFIPFYQVGPILTLTFVVLVIQGALVGKVLELYHKRDLVGVTTWGKRMAGGFLVLAVLVALKGINPAILMAISLACLGYGLKTLDGDRKRGYNWLSSDEVNRQVTVYSFGIPLFTLGVICLAWAISL